MTLPRALLAIAAILPATPAEAHAFGARYDLPLPLGLYLTAAGLAVAASFLGAVVFLRWARARTFYFDVRVPAWSGRALSALLGVVGGVVLAVLLGAAFLGPPAATHNLATITIWVLWWVGFLLFSALVVCLWPQVDPFRRGAALATRAVGRPWQRGTRNLPAAAGLLAPMGLLALAWLELVSDWSEQPRALGVIVILYLAGAVMGGLAFGQAWFRVADPLSRIFAVFDSVAPISARGGAVLRIRLPGEGLLAPSDPPRGQVLLVTALIGVVLFDGLSETPAWAAVLNFISESQSLRPTLLWLREQGADLVKVIRSIGLLATVAVFYGVYGGLVLAMRRLTGGEVGRVTLARHFVGVLLPIAVAYHLSHYTSYFLLAGQLVFAAASDPFGLGWTLFATRQGSIDTTVIGAKQVWWIAFSALVAGHALSVLVAHRRALQLFDDSRRAALSQVPMMAAMIGLTVLSLWILAQPITE